MSVIQGSSPKSQKLALHRAPSMAHSLFFFTENSCSRWSAGHNAPGFPPGASPFEAARNARAPVEDVATADEILDAIAHGHGVHASTFAAGAARPSTGMDITFGPQFWASDLLEAKTGSSASEKTSVSGGFGENWLGNLDSHAISMAY
jgi:hypothetical protein